MRNLEAKELEGVELVYAKAKFSGHGHYKVWYEFKYKGYYNTLTRVTDNMPTIDRWMDEDDIDDKIDILSELVNMRIEEDLYEWKLKIDEN